MIVIVWKIAGDFEIKFGAHAGRGSYTRVIFKGVQDGKEYAMNLPEEKVYAKSAEWRPYLKGGNILDVELQDNGKNVNFYKPFKVIEIKDKNKEAK